MEVLDELRRRCQEAGLRFEEFDRDDPYGLMHWFLIQFPQGRSTREVEIYVGHDAIVQWFLREPFEAYAYLEEFEASWSAQHHVIECNLVDAASNARLLTNYWSTPDRGMEALGLERDNASEPEERLRFASVNGLKVSIGPSSNMHTMLSHSSDLGIYEDEEDYEDEFLIQGNVPRTLTLRIEDAEAARHDDAVEILERVANAVLFQVDLHLELPLLLERGHGQTRSFDLQRPKEMGTVSLPAARYEYDREAMSLYWYGRSASKMPLMRFLANYQVLEFYFPVYSEPDLGVAERRRTRGVAPPLLGMVRIVVPAVS